MEVIVQANTKRKRKWTKITAWIVAITIVLIAAIYFGANAYIARSLPKTEGEIQLSGLKEKVEIIRDKDGVPHIRAKKTIMTYTWHRGMFRLKIVYFKWILSRRQASGELSEVVGSAAIDKDKYFRALGLRRAAVASYDQYSNQAKDTLNWFAEGVNAFIKELDENGKWPIEFKLLGYKPKEWTPTDSLTIGKYMAFDLGGHWEDQAFRYYLLQNFSEEKKHTIYFPPILRMHHIL